MTQQRAPSTVFDLMEREFGAKVTDFENPEGVANINIADAEILKDDGSRVAFVFVNLSTATMYLRPGGKVASATNGIRVDSGGGTLITFWKEDGAIPAKSWHAIATADASSFYLLAYRLRGE